MRARSTLVPFQLFAVARDLGCNSRCFPICANRPHRSHLAHRVGTALVGVLALVFIFASLAEAQIEQGRLLGTVRDAQGGVLPGVTVTATSPALIGQRTAIAEADGRYLFTSLPSGTYALKFELQGFQTFERQGIRVTQGTTLTVDAQLQVASIQETVTVSAASPVVDMTTTKVGAAFSGEALFGVPSATDVWAVLAQTPGVRMQGFDVGGSHKSQQVGYESFGIRSQNKVMFEGIDLTETGGGTFFYSPYFAVDEVSITAVGGDVEMSSPGTALVQTYKSGGNKFSGLEHLTYEAGGFVGDNNDARLQARGFTGNPNLVFWEGHLELGGPIKKDKLWFFGSYNYFKVDKAISGVDRTVATDLVTVADPLLKVTYKASQKDTIIGFYQPRNNKKKPNRDLSASVLPESVLAQDSKVWIKKIGWQRVWTNRLFMDIKAAACCEIWPMVAKVDAAVKPPRLDTATQLQSGAGWNGRTLKYQKPQTSGTLTYYLPAKAGSHDIKFGYEFILERYQFGVNGQSGPIRYRDRNGVVDEIELIDVGSFADYGNTWKQAWTSNKMFALYAQDRWTPTNRLTFTAGLRFGYQRPYYEDGVRRPVLKETFPDTTTQGRAFFTRRNYAPRLGVTYDLFGAGKTAVKGFFGRYYAIYTNSFLAADPGGVNSKTFKFLDQNGNRLYDGPQELGTLVSSSGGASTRVDPDLKQPYADEISGSIEHQFWGESSIRAIYVHKRTRNVFGQVNTARLGTISVPVTVPNPFNPGRTIHALDIPASLRGIATNTFFTIPDSDARYHTLSLSGQKRFARGLFIQGGFDYQWRDEIRNPGSPSTSPLVADPIGVFSFGGTFPLDYTTDVKNRQKSTNWQAKLLGRYAFPYDIAVAANLRVQSGWPWSPVASIRLPNAGTQSVFLDDIKNRRSETVAILDFRVDKTFQIDRFKITGMVDLYNVLNSNAVTNFFLVSGSTFNRIIAALDPRTLQLGIRIAF